MRFAVFFLMMAFSHVHSQSIFTGIWEGKLPVRDSLTVVFNFSYDENGKLTARMDSPDQGAYDIEPDSTYATGDSVFVSVKRIGAFFRGQKVNDSTIKGAFRQGLALPLNLQKKAERKVRVKYQTPKPKYNYNVEDVSYNSEDGKITFAGTLTYPKNEKQTFPAILLISGSGPQNRDEEILGHKPFHVLADFFTKNGFAVLRYDDRGTGSSTGEYKDATTEDFIQDAAAGVKYLRSLKFVNQKKVGLLGHSEGGMIAYMLAAKDPSLDFIVLLAAPGMEIVDMMAEQNIALLKANKISDSTALEYGSLYRQITRSVIAAPDTATARLAARETFDNWIKFRSPAMIKEMGFREPARQNIFLKRFVSDISTPWFSYFFKIKPSEHISKLTCRVLALNGEKDVQVVAAPNLEAIRSALKASRSPAWEVKMLDSLNHLFQHCSKCTPDEYGKIDETFSVSAMEEMLGWLRKNVINQK